MNREGLFSGMRAFTVVWLGQIVSLLGTGMTRFAITIWAWQTTGEATTLALVGFFAFGPTILLSPVAGALVDRWNRKLVMMISDLAAGLATVALLLLYFTGQLQIWHLYAAGAFAGAFEAFQFPAYSAAITTMLPKEHYTRASGMLSLAESASAIVAPILAGILLVSLGLGGIMLIDIVTFLFAIAALLLVRIPQPATSASGQEGRGSLRHEILYGFHYIFKRPSLLGLQLIFLVGNFITNFSFILLPALILARTNNNEIILGSVQSALGVGGLIGGLTLSLWGGPKRKVHGVLLGCALSGLTGLALLGLARQVSFWIVGAFCDAFLTPFINGSNQAIWQSKVAPDVQGRVFAARRLIAQVTALPSILLAGPLADRVFEPAMRSSGVLADIFGGLVGVGPGAGMGLMFVSSGLLAALVGLSGYAFRPIRDAETLLPDHDTESLLVAEAVT